VPLPQSRIDCWVEVEAKRLDSINYLCPYGCRNGEQSHHWSLSCQVENQKPIPSPAR
jgi:hypothetical protein